MLVARGHHEHDVIHEYSLGKLMMYYKAAVVNELEQKKAALLIARVAEHATGEQFEDFSKSLSPSDERVAEEVVSEPGEMAALAAGAI